MPWNTPAVTLPGTLLHIDAIKHAWFHGRQYDLITILDDATSEI